jgi:hypothetical protein
MMKRLASQEEVINGHRNDIWYERISRGPILEAMDECPVLDCLPDAGPHLVTRRWGEAGGEVANAFENWANLPSSSVVKEIPGDQARMILVCPDWARDVWWKSFQELVVHKIFWRKGQKIFRAPGRSIGGTKSGICAYLLYGGQGQEETLVFSVKHGGGRTSYSQPLPPLSKVSGGNQGK